MAGTENNKATYFKYWGKAQPVDETKDAFHLLPYHSLDVAAVGQVYLQQHAALTKTLAHVLGLPATVFREWMVYMLAIHDIGKFAHSFQGLAPEALRRLQNRQPSKGYSIRHDTLGYALWRERYEDQRLYENLFQLPDTAGNCKRPFRIWAAAVTGHHGQPPNKNYERLDGSFYSNDLEAADTFVRDASFLLDEQTPETLDSERLEDAMPTVSWWLAGIAVLCDWLGSNRKFFPYCADPTYGLEGYWPHALGLAEKAIQQSNVLPVAPSADFAIQNLLPAGAELTSLQETAADLTPDEDPQLFILEDLTGSGKTEAAVALAHQLMQQGQADGVYFGLPTMATANAMYNRIADFHSHLFEQPQMASLVLAHGQRRLLDQFNESLIQQPPDEADLDEGTASARCAAWLADNTKKALLASAGVGTIDQALMAILHSRHQAMRLLGLFRKVLIVDEVHANDSYMHKLLCTLLRFHAAADGSAILLSATLPQQMRSELCTAFAKGRNQAQPALPDDSAYPLLTHWSATAGLATKELQPASRATRDTAVQLIHSSRHALAIIRQTVASGQCICWIRNTVADAREAASELRTEFGDNVTLFHARFMMGDRLDIEQTIVEQFDKNSSGEQRAGQTLVATQVVEQSLDIDFDVMISDIAPIDLLIQRAGRLHRHTRDAHGNRTDAQEADGRPAPTLHVLCPDPADDTDADWMKRFLPGTAAVYPNHAVLWRTTQMLGQRQCLKVPEHTRVLIEGAYGQDAIATPEALETIALEVEGQDKADSSVADYNQLAFEQGYSADSQHWSQDTSTPTRLGEPTSKLCLLHWDGAQLQPLYGSPTPHPWQMSQVSIRQYLAASEAVPKDPTLAQALKQLRADNPFLKQWILLVPMTDKPSSGYQGKARDAQERTVTIAYSFKQGLEIKKA